MSPHPHRASWVTSQLILVLGPKAALIGTRFWGLTHQVQCTHLAQTPAEEGSMVVAIETYYCSSHWALSALCRLWATTHENLFRVYRDISSEVNVEIFLVQFCILFSCATLHTQSPQKEFMVLVHHFSSNFIHTNRRHMDISAGKGLWWLKGRECLKSTHILKSKSNAS